MYGQSRARKTWKPVRACDPWDARTNLNLLRCCGHMQTCGLRVFYDVLTKGSQEPVRLPYGACTDPYGTCACTVRTRVCTVRVWEHPYDHSHVARASPGDGRGCTYRSMILKSQNTNVFTINYTMSYRCGWHFHQSTWNTIHSVM